MNVFEDLIDELKEENLLELTVMDPRPQNGTGHREMLDVPAASYNTSPPAQKRAWETEAEIAAVGDTDSESDPDTIAFETAAEDVDLPSLRAEKGKPQEKPSNGKEFYQTRAVTEISNLQMVEHVLTGDEREYMKVVPDTFDDFNAKKALSAFLKVTENENSKEHTQAEFDLMHETEAWCMALATRDRKVQVSSLRQYCENSRPPLSSQALLSLARFYRNLPYSEPVRAKFDFVITRLFSRPIMDDKRVCLFPREDILTHINALYKQWSSIALYGAEVDPSNVLMTALSFDDLAIEAENAGRFDQLVESDFFGRLRLFKESVTEMFYAPDVISAVIETNVRVGNAYVTLIDHERKKMDAESIHSKYGDLHDSTISAATARTLELGDLLRPRTETVEPDEYEAASFIPEVEDEKPEFIPEAPPVFARSRTRPEPEPKPVKEPSEFFTNIRKKAMSVNRVFIAISGLLIAASIGLYIYSNYFITETVVTSSAKTVQFDSPLFNEHIQTAKLSGETLYGLLAPSWDSLPKEKRLEFLQRVYDARKDRGYTQVNLITKDGKPAAFASATRMDVIMP